MLRSFAVPNRPDYDVSLPIVTRRRCRVDDIDIVGESSSPSCDDGPRASYDFSKSVDTDESYGNAIVLTILKDVINNVYHSVGTRADVVTRC
jgi:hypothetical protein